MPSEATGNGHWNCRRLVGSLHRSPLCRLCVARIVAGLTCRFTCVVRRNLVFSVCTVSSAFKVWFLRKCTLPKIPVPEPKRVPAATPGLPRPPAALPGCVPAGRASALRQSGRRCADRGQIEVHVGRSGSPASAPYETRAPATTDSLDRQSVRRTPITRISGAMVPATAAHPADADVATWQRRA